MKLEKCFEGVSLKIAGFLLGGIELYADTPLCCLGYMVPVMSRQSGGEAEPSTILQVAQKLADLKLITPKNPTANCRLFVTKKGHKSLQSWLTGDSRKMFEELKKGKDAGLIGVKIIAIVELEDPGEETDIVTKMKQPCSDMN